MLRSSIICTRAAELIAVLEKLKNGFTFPPNGDTPQLRVSLARMKNKASKKELDPTHFRNVLCNLRLEFDDGLVHFGELQVHHREIRDFNEESHAHDAYEFFRTELGGSYGPVLNNTLERTILFLEEASGVPVLLSMLVLVFERHGQQAAAAKRTGQKAKADLPSTRMELYKIATRSAITKSLTQKRENGKSSEEIDDSSEAEYSKEINLADKMLSRVAVANMEAQLREFDVGHVEKVLTPFSDEYKLWKRLQKEGKLPLI